MAAWLAVTVDDNHPRVGFAQQRIGKSHAHGACADNQIIGFQLGHVTLLLPRGTKQMPHRLT